MARAFDLGYRNIQEGGEQVKRIGKTDGGGVLDEDPLPTELRQAQREASAE